MPVSRNNKTTEITSNLLQPYWKSECGRAVIYVGDCREVLSQLEPNQFHAVVTDPPYGLKFMGLEFDAPWKNDGKIETCNEGTDVSHLKAKYLRHNVEYVRDSNLYQEWFHLCAEEILRAAKPGAHLLSFGGTRMWHRMACAIEDAGWEIRDTVAWVYGCLSDDTEILTVQGWEHFHKINEGNPVLCYNPESDIFQWEPIQEVVVYDYQDTAYRIYSDCTDQLVSRNHRCLVERDGGYIFQQAETLQLEAGVPILEDLQGLLSAFCMFQPYTSGAARQPQSTGQQIGKLGVIQEQQRPQVVRGARYTTTDLARVEQVEYKGKVWCVRVPSGAFVARRNGKIFVTGNSGFPKSMDVSKAIDKMLGAKQEISTTKIRTTHKDGIVYQWAGGNDTGVCHTTIPTTDAAKQWDGWGTALKPAHEPIIVARKPFIGSVANNVIGHGCGGINVDGCRVGNAGGTASVGEPNRLNNVYGDGMGGLDIVDANKGRWPANLILSYPDDKYELRDNVTPEQLRQLADWMNENA